MPSSLDIICGTDIELALPLLSAAKLLYIEAESSYQSLYSIGVQNGSDNCVLHLFDAIVLSVQLDCEPYFGLISEAKRKRLPDSREAICLVFASGSIEIAFKTFCFRSVDSGIIVDRTFQDEK